MKIANKYLLLLAGIVWGIAGYNVLHIGWVAYPPYVTTINELLSLGVFIVFQVMVFSKLVKKHTARIIAYKQKQYFFKFFDRKSFIIMAVMISGGIIIRNFSLAPHVYIAVFYTGLGASLMMAGVTFIFNYIKIYQLAKG